MSETTTAKRQSVAGIQVVRGTQAEHSISLVRQKFANWDEVMQAYYASDVREWMPFSPENGADFKSVSAATGWLKKLLKKNGWPESTSWLIQETYVVETGRTSISVYLT